MRALVMLCILGLWACDHEMRQDDGDVESLESIIQSLAVEGSSYNNTEVFECSGGGQVTISVMWMENEEPPRKQFQMSWKYEECETYWHGTIDGRASYSKNQYIPCFDKPGYVSPHGETCEDWQGYDCELASEEWGYTDAEEEELIASCAKSCNMCVRWFTGANYFADLSYSGTMNEDCKAYMNMSRTTPRRIRDVEIKGYCKHPVRRWWSAW